MPHELAAGAEGTREAWMSRQSLQQHESPPFSLLPRLSLSPSEHDVVRALSENTRKLFDVRTSVMNGHFYTSFFKTSRGKKIRVQSFGKMVICIWTLVRQITF